VGFMLELYRKRFNLILKEITGKKRTLLLANLMTEMEGYYKISMNRTIFECETTQPVKELYLEISNAREL